jgi:hypothetical protein
MSPRMRVLIREFAKAFLDGRDPFNHDFLIKHNVNSAELAALEDFIGGVLMMYLQQSGGVPE